jgi:hypothetical protein
LQIAHRRDKTSRDRGNDPLEGFHLGASHSSSLDSAGPAFRTTINHGPISGQYVG